MIINLIDQNLAKVILFFVISPGSNYSRKEIKEKTKMNNIPLDGALFKLLIFKLIKRKNRLYSLNLENFFIQKIIEENKEKISNLPLKIQFIIIDFINQVSKFRDIAGIILFGSYSKLIFSEKSDIDLAIIFNNKIKNKEKNEKRITNLADTISQKYKKAIQPHFFIESDLTHKEDPMIKDILKNGKPLN